MKNITISDVVNDEKDADFVVVNSCTVTNSADSNFRHYINQTKKNYPNIKILLTGCGAHSIGENMFNNGDVFGVFGHSEKENINNILKNNSRFYEIGDLDFVNENIVTDIKGRSRAFIKIQEGCDFECAYCILPSVRGDSRSMPEIKILDQIKILSQNGFSEFILTGINIGSYGKDTNTNISKLIKNISKISGVKRIRLGSLEPSQIDDEFMEILDESLIEKHLHIALQHTSDKMLRIMNRRNRFKSSLALFEKLADKNIALGTDYIVGHPGESDEIWKEALENFKKFPLTHGHIFRYSPRDGTKSAKLKIDVRGDEAKDRLKTLEEIINKNNFDFRKKQKNLKVLIEEYKNEYYHGFDQFFNKVLVKSDEDIVHHWIDLENYEIKENYNMGNI
jgi:MiaB-like tRNA modifying enzyme